MRTFRASAAVMLLVGLLGGAFAGSAVAADCGTAKKITIADMTWLSASTLAHVTRQILTAGYGCVAELTPGDTVPTATSMLTRGQPNIAPEFWVSTTQDIWNQIQKKGNVYKANDIFASGGEEGWWVPDYVLKENPQIKSVQDLKANWKVFASPENPDKGRLYSSPPGWASEIITSNLYKALGLQSSFELFSPGSGEALKASIARAVARHQAFVGYYWSPTEVIGKYHLVRLAMPAYDADKFVCLTKDDCANPQLTGWKNGEVVVAVSSDIKTTAPAVATFLGKLQVPNDKLNEVLAWGDTNGASPDQLAQHFLKDYASVWKAWVPADVAQKIQTSLR
ncbi:glycine/betaine ABC transporter substrate-binding protein [Caballeronia sp. LjRoot34]|uniref:glycine betaine ABC transporter substrate-binding protein n=1 Tax=Caballeronia sp. LjRoot34 TaxID=3342325 RepID=UPI003ECFA20F